MKRFMNSASLVLVLTAVTGMVLPGCESHFNHSRQTRPNNPIKDEFTAGIDRAPTPQTLLAMSRLLTARNREAQAEYVLNRIVEENPGFIPAYIELAELMMRRSATDQAMTTLTKGLEIDPGNHVLINNLGFCMMVTEDYDGALSKFKAASEVAPYVTRYRANQGVVLALMGEYDQAFEQMLSVHSDKDAHRNLGMICQANGDEERAALEFRMAEEPHSEHP